MYWVIRKINPKRAKKATVTAPLAAENARSENRETSSIGWRVRRSMVTKSMPAPSAIAKPARLRGEPQPQPGASMIV